MIMYKKYKFDLLKSTFDKKNMHIESRLSYLTQIISLAWQKSAMSIFVSCQDFGL